METESKLEKYFFSKTLSVSKTLNSFAHDPAPWVERHRNNGTNVLKFVLNCKKNVKVYDLKQSQMIMHIWMGLINSYQSIFKVKVLW